MIPFRNSLFQVLWVLLWVFLNLNNAIVSEAFVKANASCGQTVFETRLFIEAHFFCRPQVIQSLDSIPCLLICFTSLTPILNHGHSRNSYNVYRTFTSKFTEFIRNLVSGVRQIALCWKTWYFLKCQFRFDSLKRNLFPDNHSKWPNSLSLASPSCSPLINHIWRCPF